MHSKGPTATASLWSRSPDDPRTPWTGAGIAGEKAIRGFHSVSMRLADDSATAELLEFMNYEEVERTGRLRRLRMRGQGNGAALIDLDSVAAPPGG